MNHIREKTIILILLKKELEAIYISFFYYASTVEIDNSMYPKNR